MSRLLFQALGLALLCAGCATELPREPVRPEPAYVPQNEACAAKGPPDDSVFDMKFDPRPYGWALVRFDVERGAVTHIEIIDASPRHVVEAPTMALFQKMRFPSGKSAQGCVGSHKWG